MRLCWYILELVKIMGVLYIRYSTGKLYHIVPAFNFVRTYIPEYRIGIQLRSVLLANGTELEFSRSVRARSCR
jgi:hypothetical protein